MCGFLVFAITTENENVFVLSTQLGFVPPFIYKIFFTLNYKSMTVTKQSVFEDRGYQHQLFIAYCMCFL